MQTNLRRILFVFNLGFASITALLLFVFIGFYLLPMLGIFQVVVMLAGFLHQRREHSETRKLFRMYWLGMAFYLLIGTFFASSGFAERGLEDTSAVVILSLLTLFQAVVCVFYTHRLWKHTPAVQPRSGALDEPWSDQFSES